MNTITISLTHGLFGDKVKEICKVSGKDLKDLTANFWKAVEEFKDKEDTKANYKVEMYCRLLQNGEDHSKVGIDFGDYSTFILAEDIPPKMLFPN